MPDKPARSGCAVMSGGCLVAIGSLILAHNLLGLVGVSPLRVATRGLVWFGDYWPLLLIAWGVYKLYQRVVHPERSSVTAAEVVILAWILVAGLAVRGARHVMEEMAGNLSSDDFAFVLGPDLLGPVHRVVETSSFDLHGAEGLVIENRRGRVVVVGSDESTLEVTLTKQTNDFSASAAERAMSEVTLEFRAGTEAEVRTSRESDGRAVVTDLVLRVPRKTPVSIVNHRGAVRIEGLDAPAKVVTSDGNVDAADLSSGVDVETSRGTIRIERLTGSAIAINAHGAIRIVGVDGDVSAKTDRHSITVEDVTGNVSLETAHGTVRAIGISGSVGVDSPYSEVSIERAAQSVTIAASHRPIYVRDVGGRVDSVSRFASVVVRGVEGDVVIDNANRPVSVFDAGGNVSITGEKAEVEVDGVAGAVRIASTYEDIRVSRFGASLDVRASDANVDVTATRVTDTLRVETSRGDVSVTLPSDVSASFTGSTRDGELSTEFRELSLDASGDGRELRWSGVLGSGTHSIAVVTSYGDITVARVER